jgi:paraquat-inducible protein B
MIERRQNLHETSELPRAKVTRKSRFNLVWIVPIVAGIIAAWLVYQNLRHIGPTIVIRFEDGKGIQPGQTAVRFRGARVGEVSAVELNPDMKSVAVKVRLEKFAAHLAREGSSFWIVKADVSAGSLSGLDTIVGGPYIQALAGTGPVKKNFVGLEQGPLIIAPEGGLDITLSWPELGWLNPGAPLYYRGVEAGVVRDYSLGEHATNIIIHAHIHPRFAPLVRQNSEFWNAGGIKADFGLFRGLSVSAETLKAMLIGGIAFATPSPPGPEPEKDVVFRLHEKAEEKWLKWAPDIDLGPQTNNPEPPTKLDLKQLPAAAAGVNGH